MHCYKQAGVFAVLLASCVVAAAATTHTSGSLATDTPWQTPYYVIDSAVDGPTLLADPVLQSADPELASLRNLNTWEDYQLALAQVATDAD